MCIVAKMSFKLDVKKAFLNGEFKEDISVIQLEGFQIEGPEENV